MEFQGQDLHKTILFCASSSDINCSFSICLHTILSCLKRILSMSEKETSHIGLVSIQMTSTDTYWLKNSLSNIGALFHPVIMALICRIQAIHRHRHIPCLPVLFQWTLFPCTGEAGLLRHSDKFLLMIPKWLFIFISFFVFFANRTTGLLGAEHTHTHRTLAQLLGTSRWPLPST